MNHEEAISKNRINWDERTPIHLRSPMYRRGIQTLRAGGVTLAPPTDTEIGDVAGLRVLHLQCHIGLDTLSLARLGANVTGLDFSPKATTAAAELSRELNLPARFVTADAQRADEALAGETFDLVFASFGVFCWIGDLDRWIASAARLLAPGGALYIADGHPVMDMFEDDDDSPYGVDIRYGYFDRSPCVFGPGPTYADDGEGRPLPESVEYLHGLGDFPTAAARAGLRVEFLHEFPGCFFHRHRTMIEDPAGDTWDFPPPLAGKLPMVFSMKATAT